jgi:type III pantothenate kinase
MLLAVDVGNTHTVIGLYEGRELARHWRVITREERTADEYGVLLRNLFLSAEMGLPCVGGMVVACVVPPMIKVMQEVALNYFGLVPLVVGPGVKTGMPILCDNPREIGADRIVNAVAAFERYHEAVVVVDFGTATTFDFITPQGEYLGGAIVPGIGISLNAMFEKTAKLYRVELTKPPRVVGRNTVHAVQSGIFYG